MWRILEKLALVLLPVVVEELGEAIARRREAEATRRDAPVAPPPANDIARR